MDKDRETARVRIRGESLTKSRHLDADIFH